MKDIEWLEKKTKAPEFFIWGMTYEKKAIQHALIEKPNMDPMTGPFEGEAKLVPNHGLRGAITQWREQGMRPQANEGSGGGGGAAQQQEYPDELVAWFSDLKISEAKTHEALDYLCGDEVGATEVEGAAPPPDPGPQLARRPLTEDPERPRPPPRPVVFFFF